MGKYDSSYELTIADKIGVIMAKQVLMIPIALAFMYMTFQLTCFKLL